MDTRLQGLGSGLRASVIAEGKRTMNLGGFPYFFQTEEGGRSCHGSLEKQESKMAKLTRDEDVLVLVSARIELVGVW